MAFQSKGKQAQWKYIFDLLEARLLTSDPTKIITWNEFNEACGFDVRTTRAAIYRASQEMLEKHSRTVVSVRGEGYRLDTPSSRLGLVREQEKRGLQHYNQAEELATNVPVDLLTADQLKELDLRKRALMNITNALSRHDRDIQENRSYVERVDQRLASVEERLRLIGVMPETAEPQLVEGEVVEPEA